MATEQLVKEYAKLANEIPNPYRRNIRQREYLKQRIEKELVKRGVQIQVNQKGS
jgi:hypothetical protein